MTSLKFVIIKITLLIVSNIFSLLEKNQEQYFILNAFNWISFKLNYNNLNLFKVKRYPIEPYSMLLV